MIDRFALQDRVREWQLSEEVVEKDYVLGWVLCGIGAHPVLADAWAFKGGTSLKKCYIETYRFSEDLDFTVMPGGPVRAEEVALCVREVLERVSEESGVNFGGQAPRYKTHSSGGYTEVRIYYQGPRDAKKVAKIKLDVSGAEVVVRPTVWREIAHPYPDQLPAPGKVRCYSFEEVFAEKIRAMGERGRPRDLYDIINLFRREDLRSDPDTIREVLEEKCRTKGVRVPSFEDIEAAGIKPVLAADWENMLAHQLPVLPMFEDFWQELPRLFDWLRRKVTIAPLAAVGMGREEQPYTEWTPPPMVHTWNLPVPLEIVRFAAANQLCVRLSYKGRGRTIEPYSLRRTRDGHLLLYGFELESGQIKAFRVDRIEGVEAAKRAFTPRYRIEFSATGTMAARPAVSARRSVAPPSQSRPVYVVECPVCHRRFRRKTRTTNLATHKNEYGGKCCGRQGRIVATDY